MINRDENAKATLLLIRKGQIWKNKKTQMDYEILSLATGCDNDRNGETVVIYTAGSGGVCTRYYTEFLQKFTLFQDNK